MYNFLYIPSFFSPAWMLGVYDSMEISGFIAHNVLNMRRSSPPYKANRRFAVGWNVGERKPHKAALAATAVFRTLSRRLSAA